MPRIASDPSLETCPDFDDPIFDVVRQALVENLAITDDLATQRLAETWTQHNNTRKEAWAAQQQADQLEREQEEEAQRLAREEELRQEREAAEAEQRELDRKKPKMSDFNRNRPAPDFLFPLPASFAINKLENFEYVELWYFTADGCAEAARHHRTVAEEAFGLTQKDSIISIKPLSSYRASNRVVRDQDLTWRQFETAKTAFLIHATKAGWPKEHREALATCWRDLETHEYRDRSHGERMLLLYQARIRKEWHDSMKRQDSFNIALFNDTLLRSISDEVWHQVKEEESKT
jgi:hypothetical protein